MRRLTAKDAALAERLRNICMALPEANERVSHGEPTWFAGKVKVFAMLDNHHHGAEHLSVWLPMPCTDDRCATRHRPPSMCRWRNPAVSGRRMLGCL